MCGLTVLIIFTIMNENKELMEFLKDLRDTLTTLTEDVDTELRDVEKWCVDSNNNSDNITYSHLLDCE